MSAAPKSTPIRLFQRAFLWLLLLAALLLGLLLPRLLFHVLDRENAQTMEHQLQAASIELNTQTLLQLMRILTSDQYQSFHATYDPDRMLSNDSFLFIYENAMTAIHAYDKIGALPGVSVEDLTLVNVEQLLYTPNQQAIGEVDLTGKETEGEASSGSDSCIVWLLSYTEESSPDWMVLQIMMSESQTAPLSIGFYANTYDISPDLIEMGDLSAALDPQDFYDVYYSLLQDPASLALFENATNYLSWNFCYYDTDFMRLRAGRVLDQMDDDTALCLMLMIGESSWELGPAPWTGELPWYRP